MPRVLVTRPEPGASRTAKKLAAMGFEPVLLPLTRIVPIPLEVWPDADDFQAVAITSANAVRHARPAFLRQIAHLPAFAVGARTGEAAREAGLRVADCGAGNAVTLAGRIADAVAPGMRVLILCGRIRRKALEEGLTDAGIETFAMETYHTVPTLYGQTAGLGAPVDAVLLFSAFGAELFAQLAESAPFHNASCFAISERVAEMLPERLLQRTHVAPEPTEEAMLSLLAQRL